MSFDPTVPKTKPSLGARFYISSAQKSLSRKKPNPKNCTLATAVDKHLQKAVDRLAIKLKVTRSHAIEIALREMCEKHGIEVGGPEDV